MDQLQQQVSKLDDRIHDLLVKATFALLAALVTACGAVVTVFLALRK